MSTIQHTAVIATTWCNESYLKITDWITSLSELDKLARFGVHLSNINNMTTIVLMPSGKNYVEGEIDTLQEQFIQEIKKCAYEDGSNSFKWVQVSYGELGQGIICGNNSALEI
jgi:hypothetical protein